MKDSALVGRLEVGSGMKWPTRSFFVAERSAALQPPNWTHNIDWVSVCNTPHCMFVQWQIRPGH